MPEVITQTASWFQLVGMALSGALFITEVTLLLWVLVARRRPHAFWDHCSIRLGRRPWGQSDVIWCLGILLVMNLPALAQQLAPVQTPPEEMAAPSTLGVVMVLIYTLTMYGATLFAIWCRLSMTRCTWRHAFGGYTGSDGLHVRQGILYGMRSVPAIVGVSAVFLALLTSLGVPLETQPAISMVSMPGLAVWQRALLLLLVIVAAPIGEEFLFRGVLLPALLRGGSWPRALLLQALLFGAIHMHLPSFAALTAAGMLFGMGYMATGSILTPIVMHMVFNATGILILFSFEMG